MSKSLEQMNRIKEFVSKDQFQALNQGLKSEEREFFIDKVAEVDRTLSTMPKTYETDGQGEEAIAHLHYFGRSADIYITERDTNPGQHQAFGYSCLGDIRDAEFGYVSIPEITKAGLELDLHFEPKRIKEIKTEALLDEGVLDRNDTPINQPVKKTMRP